MTLIDRDLGTPAPDRAERTPAPATVEVTIDGQGISVAEGTSVMRAAALAGVDVPKLCATDRLDAFGSCRLCVVEIDGRKTTRFDYDALEAIGKPHPRPLHGPSAVAV